MKLRMLVDIAGRGFLAAGEVTERFSDAEAIRLIEAGYAVPVNSKGIEIAVKPVVETRRKGKPNVVSADRDERAGV